MEMPKKIRISGVDYIVELTDVPICLEHKECYGCVDYDSGRIRISTSGEISDAHRCITVLHEMLHAILADRDVSTEDDGEEKIVDQLSRGLYQVIRDNPGIFYERGR